MNQRDADVMKQGRFLDKVDIYRGIRQGPGNVYGLCRHHFTVLENYFEGFPVFAEIPL